MRGKLSFRVLVVRNVNRDKQGVRKRSADSNKPEGFFIFFLDVVHLRRLSAARTTSQIAANVGRQQPATTAGLPAVFLRPPSSCGPSHPVAVPQPARHALQPAVQRQPGGPQPHELTGLHPRSVLPASDRAHQGDGHPGPWRPLTVCCQGARLLHRGSEGTFCRLYFGFSILRL